MSLPSQEMEFWGLPAISTYFVTNAKDLGHPEFYLKDFGIQLLSLQSVL
jgi:hypothetical protein